VDDVFYIQVGEEMEYITLEEWKERANKLNKSYDSRTKLRHDCEKKLGDYFLVLEYGAKKLVGIYPCHVEETGDDRVHTMRDVKWYCIGDKHLKLMDAEKMIEGIIDVLHDKVDVKKLIEDALHDSSPDDLQEIFDRAVIKKGKVREKEGCYKLLIGGKRGQPFEFMLRS